MEKTEMDNYESGSSYESPFDVATIGWPVIDGVKYRVSVHGINAKGGTSIREPTPWVCDGIPILDGLPSPQYRNLYQLFMDANSAQRESFLAWAANQVPDRRRRKTRLPPSP